MSAYGVFHYLKQQGISVPEDISLIGYDDIFFSEILSVPPYINSSASGGNGNRGGPADDSDYSPETETGYKEKYYVSAVFGGQTEYGGSSRCNAHINISVFSAS